MHLLHVASRATVGVLLFAALTACSNDPDESALTLEGDEESSGSVFDRDEEDDAEAPDIDLEGAGRSLTTADIEDALPTVDDLPEGWVRDPDEDDEDDGEDTIEPAECQEIMTALEDQADEIEPAAEASREFQADDFGPFLMVEVKSYEEPMDEDRLPEMRDALAECREFTSTDEDGATAEFTTEGLSFPNFGEESLAFRMDLDLGMFAGAAEIVFVRAGHNGITFMSLAFGDEPDTELLEEIARTTMERLAG